MDKMQFLKEISKIFKNIEIRDFQLKDKFCSNSCELEISNDELWLNTFPSCENVEYMFGTLNIVLSVKDKYVRLDIQSNQQIKNVFLMLIMLIEEIEKFINTNI